MASSGLKQTVQFILDGPHSTVMATRPHLCIW
jgi:hypothetical protein